MADCAIDYAFILLDTENRVTDWSAGAERILGYTQAEILGQSGALFFTPEDRQQGAVEQELETARRTGRSEDERWHLRKDGSRFWASGVMTALRDGALHGYAKVLRDLTERQQAEQALRDSEHRLQLAQQVAGIATWDWNIVENRCEWSDSMGPFFGLPLGVRLRNVDVFLEHTHPDNRATVENHLQKTLQQDAPYEVRFRTVWPDGGVHWLLAVGRVFRNEGGEPLRLLGVATDVTDRQKREELAERERQQTQAEIQWTRPLLASTKAEVQALTLRLATVQEEERRRLARELYDTAAQRLALLEMELHALLPTAPAASPLSSERIQRLQQRTRDLAEELRQLAHQLHPSLLDHFGLRVALRQLVNDFQAHWPQPVEFFASDLPDDLPLPIATALYRITQEALRNIAKHAPGALVLVTVRGSSEHVLLRLEDDGLGFVSRRGERPRGLGLISMEERVRLLGGRWVLRTRPGREPSCISACHCPGPDWKQTPGPPLCRALRGSPSRDNKSVTFPHSVSGSRPSE